MKGLDKRTRGGPLCLCVGNLKNRLGGGGTGDASTKNFDIIALFCRSTRRNTYFGLLNVYRQVLVLSCSEMMSEGQTPFLLNKVEARLEKGTTSHSLPLGTLLYDQIAKKSQEGEPNRPASWWMGFKLMLWTSWESNPGPFACSAGIHDVELGDMLSERSTN